MSEEIKPPMTARERLSAAAKRVKDAAMADLPPEVQLKRKLREESEAAARVEKIRKKEELASKTLALRVDAQGYLASLSPEQRAAHYLDLAEKLAVAQKRNSARKAKNKAVAILERPERLLKSIPALMAQRRLEILERRQQIIERKQGKPVAIHGMARSTEVELAGFSSSFVNASPDHYGWSWRRLTNLLTQGPSGSLPDFIGQVGFGRDKIAVIGKLTTELAGDQCIELFSLSPSDTLFAIGVGKPSPTQDSLQFSFAGRKTRVNCELTLEDGRYVIDLKLHEAIFGQSQLQDDQYFPDDETPPAP